MEESLRIRAYRELLAARLTTIRTELGLSQAEVAGAADTTQNIVFRLESDVRVGFEGFFKVLLYYVEQQNVNPEWLFVADNAGVPRRRENVRRIRGRLALLGGFLEALSAFDAETSVNRS